MTTHYHILEYTTSELQNDGTPFAIILFREEERLCPLGGFVLRNWEEVLCDQVPSDISIIRDFLCDIVHYSQAEEILLKGFFQRLGVLGAGPIRTFASGTCSPEDLDALASTFFGLAAGGNPWQDCFDNVIASPGEISKANGIPS